MRFIVTSGPVIIEGGKLLVNRGDKDDFYKLPGGTVEEGDSLYDACIREVREEINAEIEIIKPLNPLIIYKNPQSGEKMTIVLIHYLAKLKNKDKIRAIAPIKEIKWINISEIKKEKYKIAPNIKFLIEQGDIK
ncbi:MAG: NUDIX domain-containing protein [Nanoarchaeota archaeon]